MKLRFEVRSKIQRPLEQVFMAVYDPSHLTRYFATNSASGPLAEGTTVVWDFADFPGGFPVKVIKTIPNKQIVLEWEAAEGGYNTRVEMNFEPIAGGGTQFSILESGWKTNQAALDSSYMNCQGWMQMSCCLKAYLEYGINLRQGFF